MPDDNRDHRRFMIGIIHALWMSLVLWTILIGTAIQLIHALKDGLQ